MRDLFDVTAWALGHYPLDASRIALTGYSQGGLHTNLGQVWAVDSARARTKSDTRIRRSVERASQRAFSA